MSTDTGDRTGLVSKLISALRAFNRQAVLFSDAVAERLGMATSDVECLEVLISSGPATAGHLAEVTGLSTGAVTRMVDRLEQAGYVRRVPDAMDRRRVIVEAVPERTASVTPLFESIERVTAAQLERYSDEQLRLVLEFVEQAVEGTRAETARVRETEIGSVPGGQTFSAPLASVPSGRLVFMSGFSNLVLGSDPNADRLFVARFAGTAPRVRVRGGLVSIHAIGSPRQWLNPQGEVSFTASIPFNFDLRRGIGKVKADVSPRVEFKTRGRRDDQVRGEVLLSRRVPWDVDLRGGLARLTADLRAVDISSFDITGGASEATILLPAAGHWVPVRLIGGASDVSIQRPAGTRVRLRIRGGISGLDLDDQHFSSVGGGDVRLESREAGDGGYEIEIIGGASRLAILAVDAAEESPSV